MTGGSPDGFHHGGIYGECHVEGGMTAHYRARDPQRLAFVAARYKNVAKMLEGRREVLEIGCADGYFSPIVRQHVGALTAIDTDAASIVEANLAYSIHWPIEFKCMDAMAQPSDWFAKFDAIYALDVLEHIPSGKAEERFLMLLAGCNRNENYRVVIGTPSLESQAYASPLSKAGHVNCKTGAQLRKTLEWHFTHVIPFSMTDDAIYSGFSPMARYYLALCVG